MVQGDKNTTPLDSWDFPEKPLELNEGLSLCCTMQVTISVHVEPTDSSNSFSDLYRCDLYKRLDGCSLCFRAIHNPLGAKNEQLVVVFNEKRVCFIGTKIVWINIKKSFAGVQHI